MRQTDHVTLYFNNEISTTVVFLNIEIAFDTTWHSDLLYIWSKFEFSTRLIRLISPFLSERKFRVSFEAKCPRQEPCKQGCYKVRSCPLNCTVCMLKTPPPQTQGVHLALFADDICLYATDGKESFIVRKLQRGLSSMEAWC
jgi:hypothetical protein